MNPTNCTAISKKTQEHKPPESIILQIYPFLPFYCCSPKLSSSFCKRLVICWIVVRLCQGREPPHRLTHTPCFLPLLTSVGRRLVLPSSVSRAQVSQVALSFGLSSNLDITTRGSSGCASLRTLWWAAKGRKAPYLREGAHIPP